MVSSPLGQHVVFYVLGIILGVALGVATGQQYVREHYGGAAPRATIVRIAIGSLVVGVALGWAIDAFITYQEYLRVSR
jgi:hypothetical protein